MQIVGCITEQKNAPAVKAGAFFLHRILTVSVMNSAEVMVPSTDSTGSQCVR